MGSYRVRPWDQKKMTLAIPSHTRFREIYVTLRGGRAEPEPEPTPLDAPPPLAFEARDPVVFASARAWMRGTWKYGVWTEDGIEEVATAMGRR